MKKFSLKRRIFLIASMKGILMISLLYRVFFLQIKKFDHFSNLSEKNSRILIKILAPRGKIFERNSALIAGNEKLFRIVIFTKKKPLVQKVIDIIKTILPKYHFKSVSEIFEKQRIYSCDMCVIAENLSWDEMIKVEERRFDLPEIFIDYRDVRVYINDTKFAHIVGYVDSENTPKTGVEKFLGSSIDGNDGFHSFEINSTRSVTKFIETKSASIGKSAFVTLDYRIQSIIYDKLKENTTASSAIMMNGNTGEILAAVSYPSFSPNNLTRGSVKEMQYAFNDKLCPMINRCLSGLYMPGSLVKMAIGLAALKYKVVNRNTTFYCDKFIEIGGHKFHCWSKDGHGAVNLESAIACSCDIYFYQVGRMLGVKKMSEMFRILGLNETFSDVPDVKKGVLPDDFPVRYAADTILASIGHGNFSTTALHMCTMLCRLITNKKVVPYVIKDARNPNDIEDLRINEDDLAIVFSGMNKAFNSDIGTGRLYKNHLSDLQMFGKTTTTQVIKVQRDADGKKLPNQFRNWEERDHSMCCAGVDINGDYYVLSVIIEHGGWGRFSADLCAKIFQEMKNQSIFSITGGVN